MLIGSLVSFSCYGRLIVHSGVANYFGVKTYAGVIDLDFHDPVSVLVYKLGPNAFQINSGD